MTPAAPTHGGHGRLLLGGYLALAVVGLYSTSLGPALPAIAEEHGVALDTAGLLVTVLFAGSIAASGGVAVRIIRVDARTMTAGGLGAVAVALVVLGAAPAWWVAVASALLLGIGDGLIVAGGHLIAATAASNVAAAINRLNWWFAIGAVAGPLWAGVALEAWGEPAAVYVVLAVAPLAVAALLFSAAPAPGPRTVGGGGSAGARPLVAIMGAVLFLYVGAEFGLGTWLASYTREVAGSGVLAGALVTSAYWGALAVGRTASGYLLGRGAAPGRVLVGSITGALCASALLAAFGKDLGPGTTLAIVTGFCFGPVWPAAMAVAVGRSSNAPAALVTMGNAGGLAFPWLQGRLLVATGPGRGVAFTAVLCALMLLLAAPVRRRSRIRG